MLKIILKHKWQSQGFGYILIPHLYILHTQISRDITSKSRRLQTYNWILQLDLNSPAVLRVTRQSIMVNSTDNLFPKDHIIYAMQNTSSTSWFVDVTPNVFALLNAPTETIQMRACANNVLQMVEWCCAGF